MALGAGRAQDALDRTRRPRDRNGSFTSSLNRPLEPTAELAGVLSLSAVVAAGRDRNVSPPRLNGYIVRRPAQNRQMNSEALKRRTVPFTIGLVMSSAMVIAVAVLALGGVSSVGAAVLLVGIALFFIAKVTLLWFLRSGVQRDSDLRGFLADRQWRLVSAVYFASAACFLGSILLSHERFWATVGLVVALALGWTYFVIARKHEVA
jgi:hypothetical protein